MRGHCYAIASGKGGVGKTTTAVNAATELATRGYDVVVVDADLAMTNLGRVVGVDHEPTLHDVLAGDAALGEAIHTDGEFAVLPGSDAIDSFRDADPAGLRRILKRLQTAFEVVIVDTGAGVDHETMVACGLADDVVLVTTPDEMAVTDTAKSKAVVRKVDGHVLGAVVTRTPDAAAATSAADELGAELLGAVPEAPEVVGDEPVVTTAPQSAVAAAYSDIAERLAVAADATAAASDESAIGDD